MENYLGSEGLGPFLKSMKTYITNKTTTHVADLKGITFLEDFEFQITTSNQNNVSKTMSKDYYNNSSYQSLIFVLFVVSTTDESKYELQYSVSNIGNPPTYNSSDDTGNSPMINMWYEGDDAIEITTNSGVDSYLPFNCKLLVFGVNSLIS